MLKFLSTYPKIITVQKTHIPDQFDLFLVVYVWKNKEQSSLDDFTNIKRESCANEFLLFVLSFVFILNAEIENQS